MGTDHQISRRQKHKSHKHTQGYRQRYENRIGYSHEKHQDEQYQYKAHYKGIHQVVER